MKISVSLPTYNELISVLEIQGYKLGINTAEITIKKNDEIVRPLDVRLAMIRRDCLSEAVKHGGDWFKVANQMYEWVTTGEINKTEINRELKISTLQKEDGWK